MTRGGAGERPAGKAEPPRPGPPVAPDGGQPRRRSRGTLPGQLRRGWQEIGRWDVPQVAGNYAVYDGPTLLYVGSAWNLRNRLKEQGVGLRLGAGRGRFGLIPALRVKIRPSDRLGDRQRVEVRLIARLDPPENRVTYTRDQGGRARVPKRPHGQSEEVRRREPYHGKPRHRG